MEKSFSDVFPGIRPPSGLSGLLSHVSVEQLKYSKDRKNLLVYLNVRRLIGKQEINDIESLINDQVLCDADLSAVVIERFSLPERYTVSDVLSEYMDSLFQDISDGQHIENRFLSRAKWVLQDGNVLVVEVEPHPVTERLLNKWSQKAEELLRERFHFDLRVRFILSGDKRAYELSRVYRDTVILLEEEPAPESGENAPETDSTAATPKKKAPAANRTRNEQAAGALNSGKGRGRKGAVRTSDVRIKKDDPDWIYGRNFDDEIREIASYGNDTEGTMVIRGVIQSFESREMKNGERTILSFSVTDYTDSISVKLFAPNEEVERLSASLAPGKSVRLKGLAQYDSFDKEVTIRSVQGIFKTADFAKKTREDHARVKRVELHCHTKASENDAVTEVKDLMNTVRSWGHSAIAITDHGCVYSFPTAYHCLAKNDDLKVIYGMEGYLVDDTLDAVTNADERPLDTEYVVFDLETTGFSPVNDRIIEIGAVKIREGKIVDRFSTFVDPGVIIPYRIEELTGITNEMTASAPSIEKVLPEFAAFLGSAVAVAHNAQFDMSFVKENMRRLGIPGAEKIAYADTLAISRMLLPQIARYTLDHVAKELNISLDHHHRAVDDAECTALIFIKLLDRLKARKLETLASVRDALRPDASAIKKMPTYHVILLAKNETGRVNLYRLVSESSLNYFQRRPRIPKSVLTKYREGLIVGSACAAGELFTAVREGAADEEIARIAAFYDYLEIQPVGNNAFLLRDGSNTYKTEDDLRDLNRKIVAIGEKYGKPVCATCDVHFLNPEDEVYRAILQACSGFNEAESQAPLYLRTTDEMLEEFAYLGADKCYEVVVTNTNLIADEIERISPVRPDKVPPVIPNADEDLRESCYKRAYELYGDPLPKIVSDRLEKELSSIISNGYAVMYIIAQKLVTKSVSDGYLVGSRGSVGSSLAATMAGITEVNPLPPHYRCPKCKFSDFESETVMKFYDDAGCDMPDAYCPHCGTKMDKDGFNIPFETFLGFNGDKEPDIDLNFSGEYQSKAHAYTEVIFGKGQTYRAGTIGTVADKTAVGYVLRYFEDQGITKRRAEVTRIAKGIEGVRRTSGQHPGGIIVLPLGEDINTFTPIQHPANDQTTNIITTHFEYHSIDHNLLKLDILGHDDPTMIRMLQDLTGEDPTRFPLDSKEVMSLFLSTDALGVTPEDLRGCPLGVLGVPEFGTDMAMGMLIATKPRFLSDLVRVAGMAHGTDVWTGNAQVLIEEGTADITTVICARDDIMIFLISKGIENGKAFTIMESVRKGKGLKPDWEQDMRDHDVPDWYIWSCKKIKYMFPKAHAAAYVMMAWRIAYCKIFYPLAYYAAFFSIRAKAFSYELMCLGRDRLERAMDEYEARMDELSEKEKRQYGDMRVVQEMYARGYSFLPMDVMKSSANRFLIADDKHLLPPFNSIDGMGDKAADAVEEASKKGPYLSLNDFRDRTKVSQTILDKMVELGILASLPKTDQFSLFDQLT